LLLLAAALVGHLLAGPVVSPFWDPRVALPHASPSDASR
jgi:hypothetical protein